MDNTPPLHTNQLIHEKSLYLQQHAHNPVDWIPYSDDVFKQAQEENKLILFSIGYSACHWCHVMEHESFENETIAQVMNELYICVKIDREERPDIDQIYMDAVQIMTGRGGWPLNCITLPNGKPIYGGTYFRSDDWVKVLKSVHQFYSDNPQKALEYGEKLTQGIRESDLIHIDKSTEVNLKSVHEGVEKWTLSFDWDAGGTNRAPKFPLPNNYEFLLHYHRLFPNSSLNDYIQLSLNKMGNAGIYDHVGGGFARYATDIKWKIPHFEKMLYDNAQLISLYSKAYAVYQNEDYKIKVDESIAFLNREMKSDDHLYYAAFDADSEGQEGKFYIWNEAELKEIVKEDWSWFSSYFHIQPSEKWEGEYILHATETFEQFCTNESLDYHALSKQLNHIKKALYEIRDQRIKPGLDDKILCSWNALTISGLVNASNHLRNPAYLDMAISTYDQLKKKCWPNEMQLYHVFKEKHYNSAYLEDYAFMIQAAIDLYQATFDIQYMNDAKQLTFIVMDEFYDDQSGLFYYTSSQQSDLIVRKREMNDNVIPASNSQMAINLYQMGLYHGNQQWINIATNMWLSVQNQVASYTSGYSNWCQLSLMIHQGVKEIVVTGPQTDSWINDVRANYHPNNIYAGSMKESSLFLLRDRVDENQTRGFICEQGSCQLPISDLETFKMKVNEN